MKCVMCLCIFAYVTHIHTVYFIVFCILIFAGPETMSQLILIRKSSKTEPSLLEDRNLPELVS